MNKINVLISGINGFIGSNLRQYLNSNYAHWRVYGIDKKARNSKTDFKIALEDKTKLKELLIKLKPKYIFHLCGNTVSEDFDELLQSNVYTTFVLMSAIKEIKGYAPRVIIPSSAAEYGEVTAACALKETDELKPKSFYGFSKALQTQVSLMFAREGSDVVIARMFNVLGKAVPVSLSIGRFSHKLALIKKGRTGKILKTRTLDTKRDFLDVEDVCKCLVAVALKGKKGQVYNVCRGKSYSIRLLLNKLIVISGVQNITVLEDANLKPSDLADSFGSTLKIEKLIKGFLPKSIEQSLKDVFDYYYSRV